MRPPTKVIKIASIIVSGKPPASVSKALLISIQDAGLLCPIIVSVHEKDFILRAGHKRLVACNRLDWKGIPAVVLPALPTEITDALVAILDRSAVRDYEIAALTERLLTRYNMPASRTGKILGVTAGYACNLRRWYAEVPDVVRDAWREGDPLVNHIVLEQLSKCGKDKALGEWEKRKQLASARWDGRKKPRRPSETALLDLVASIENSKLRPAVKQLLDDAVRYVLGLREGVPGITEGKLPKELTA